MKGLNQEGREGCLCSFTEAKWIVVLSCQVNLWLFVIGLFSKENQMYIRITTQLFIYVKCIFIRDEITLL